MFKPEELTPQAATATRTWTVTEPSTGQGSPIVRHGVAQDDFVAMLAERLYGLHVARPSAAPADEALSAAA